MNTIGQLYLRSPKESKCIQDLSNEPSLKSDLTLFEMTRPKAKVLDSWKQKQTEVNICKLLHKLENISGGEKYSLMLKREST